MASKEVREPYQWYTAANNSQSSSQGQGEITYNIEPFKYRRERGVTYYELSNHLGNVLVTVTDMKIGIDNGGNWTAEYYEATVVSVNDYYPFGSTMAGRKYNQGTYRYGFNGKEEDKEWGSQMIQDYGFRIYNPTIGKFLSVDPLSSSYPWYTPYQFAGNMPIWAVDLDGLEPNFTTDKWMKEMTNIKVNTDTQTWGFVDGYWVAINRYTFVRNRNDYYYYDPQKEKWRLFFDSKIVTNALETIIDSEGGYVDNPADPGGKTKYGIAETKEWKVAAEYLGIDSKPSNIKNLTENQALKYYYFSRIEKYKINEMTNAKVVNAILDQSALTPGIINKNIRKALNELGHTFDTKSNETLSQEEIKALNVADADLFVEKFTEEQLKYYNSLNDEVHIDGWKNRLNKLKENNNE